MLTEPQRDLVRDKGTKLGRILIGALFLISGVTMFLNAQTTAGWFESLGIPLAGIAVYVVIVTKVVAGGAIVVGKRVGLAAAMLLAFSAMATLLGHMGLSEYAPYDLTAIMKNLAIMGGLLYLMAYGPGGHHTSKLVTKG